MGEFHGDEPEIEAHQVSLREAYEDEHADDWKYSEERLNDERRIN